MSEPRAGDQVFEKASCDGELAEVVSPRFRRQAEAFDPLDLAGAWSGEEPLDDLMKQLDSARVTTPSAWRGAMEYLTEEVPLLECLEKQGVVAEELFRGPQNLQAIEEEVLKIESSSLIYDHIEPIKKAEPWGGQQFWQWPSCKQFEDRQGSTPIALWDIRGRTKEDNKNREKEKATVEELLRVFRHIEPVSVVMRFLAPDRYGILSPPVEKLLEVSPSSSPTEKYLSYVDDLRVIKKNRRDLNSKRVADVDMAIWTLQQVMDHWDRLKEVVPEGEGWRTAYENDRLLREIRVRNLTRSLFRNMELADVAEALVPHYLEDFSDGSKRLHLAGQLAGIQFERAVMEVARKTITRYKGTLYADEVSRVYHERKDRLWTMVDRTLKLREDVKQNWRDAVKFRNKAVHDEKPPEYPTIKALLQSMRDAEKHGATEPDGSADATRIPRSRRGR